MAITRHRAAVVAATVTAKPVGSNAVPSDADLAMERKVLAFVGAFLALESKPEPAQIEMLASALGCDFDDVNVVIQAAVNAVPDTPEFRKDAPTSIDTKVSNKPGLNEPGDLHSFDTENVNPNGRTSLDDLESPLTDAGRAAQPAVDPAGSKGSRYNPVTPGGTYPAIQPNLASLSKSLASQQEFLQPLDDPMAEETVAVAESHEDSSIAQERASGSDGIPNTRPRTGVDDGALVDDELDEQEHDDLINDGEPSFTLSKKPDVENRHLNDDGLA